MEELIEKVREIDPKAAEYLKSDNKDVGRINWVPSYSLLGLMMWGKTPQGYDYWEKIDRQLR